MTNDELEEYVTIDSSDFMTSYFMKNNCKTCNLLTHCYPCSFCAKLCCTDCMFSVNDDFSLCLDCVIKEGCELSKDIQIKLDNFYALDSQKYKESEKEFSSIQKTNF